MFQSRNRESSNFNKRILRRVVRLLLSFNLVIENLLISTAETRSGFLGGLPCFNLVIENLLISTPADKNDFDVFIVFVSIS